MSKQQSESTASTSEWKTIGVRCPQQLLKAVRVLAAKNDKSMQDLIVEGLMDLLKKYGEKAPKID